MKQYAIIFESFRVRSLMVKQFSDKEQSDGSIPSAPTLEALYKTKFWNRDSYVRLNSLFEPCTNSTEKARSKNRRTDKLWSLSSTVERFVYIEDVGGSNPSATTKCRGFLP